MEFAILTVMMLLTYGVLMCYVGYVKSQKANQVMQQIKMVELRMEECNNICTMKKLVVLRAKLQKRLDEM